MEDLQKKEKLRKARLDYKWKAFIVTGIGAIMSTLDGSIVNVSLPTMTRELHTPIATIAWVVMSYLLTITTLLLTIGRLSDMISRKVIYIWGFVIFTVASVFCGLAPNVHILIASRVIQAIGAACLMSNAPAVLTDAFPGNERGKALGMNATIVAIGLSIGPPLGGFLTGVWGWRSIFFINLPIGILATYAAKRFLKKEVRYQKQTFDFVGALVFSIGLLALMLAISQGSEWGWKSLIICSLFVVGVIGMGLFLLIETKVKNPMLHLELFKNRLFAASNFSAFINYAAMFIFNFLMPYYLMQGHDFNSQITGCIMMSVPLTMSVIAPFSGGLSDKIGSRILSSVGLFIMGISFVILSHFGAASSTLKIIFAMMLIGFGTGLFQSPNNSAIMGSVPKHRIGIASGLLATMRNFGMVTGVALASGILTSRMRFHEGQLTLQGLSEAVVKAQAFLGAFSDALLVGALLCLIGVIASLARGTKKIEEESIA